jgi:hypothetical protein
MSEELQRRKEDEFGYFRKNWQLLVFIVSVLFGAGAWYNTLANHEPRICTLETKMEKVDVMANDITWIKDGIKELKERKK